MWEIHDPKGSHDHFGNTCARMSPYPIELVASWNSFFRGHVKILSNIANNGFFFYTFAQIEHDSFENETFFKWLSIFLCFFFALHKRLKFNKPCSLNSSNAIWIIIYIYSVGRWFTDSHFQRTQWANNIVCTLGYEK